MNVSREEAAQALSDISRASDRIQQVQGYKHGAPHFIIWGLVWLSVNSVTQFVEGSDKYAWPIALGIGFLASMATGILQSRQREKGTEAGELQRRIGSRIGMTAGVVMAFIVCLSLITTPESNREINAMISIFFPFMYMAAGIWAGWRLFAIGLVTAAAIMVGFFMAGDYFAIWMGVFGGGSLIAGGLWLRTT